MPSVTSHEVVVSCGTWVSLVVVVRSQGTVLHPVVTSFCLLPCLAHLHFLDARSEQNGEVPVVEFPHVPPCHVLRVLHHIGVHEELLHASCLLVNRGVALPWE